MTDGKTTPLAREQLEDWIETLNAHKLPDWIKEHLRRYHESAEKGHSWDASPYGGYADTPTLLLTTRGRTSGKLLTVPLIYGTDNGRCILVGSKGGAPQHPGWYLNLQAHPEAEVQVAERKFHAVARTTAGEERQRLWNKMVEIYPPLGDYQKRTERLIPVVVLDPAE